MQFGIILILIFIVCIGIGVYIFRINQITHTKIEQKMQVSDEKIMDECVKEGEELAIANSTEKKVSPNATFIFITKYNKCGHTVKEYVEVTESDVNKTEDDIKKSYSSWNLTSFANNEIVLERELNDICREHYAVRSINDEIVIYFLDKNEKEIFYKNTGISTKYLPEEDKQSIKNGIFVTGKEELNRFLEDYE